MKTAREDSPNRSDLDQNVKCTRCRNIHMIGERLYKRKGKKYLIYDEVCPRCNCKSYHVLPKEH